VFYGLGADGTVGANKNSVKIIAQDVGLYAKDTSSRFPQIGCADDIHLRFGPEPIHAPYLIASASFVACHQHGFLARGDVLRLAADRAVFLLNSPFGKDQVWDHLPRSVQKTIIEKHLRFYVIDASKVARDAGLGSRTNTILQTCFFAISGLLPRDEAIRHIKESVRKTYSRKGDEVVRQNYVAVDATLVNLFEVRAPASVTSTFDRPAIVPEDAPQFVREVTAKMMAGLATRFR